MNRYIDISINVCRFNNSLQTTNYSTKSYLRVKDRYDWARDIAIKYGIIKLLKELKLI